MTSIGIENGCNSSTSADWGIRAATAAFVIGMSLNAPLIDSKLIRNGLTENITSSRPTHIPGEQQTYMRRSSASFLLKHASGWAGDDLDQLLSEVYEIRGEVEF